MRGKAATSREIAERGMAPDGSFPHTAGIEPQGSSAHRQAIVVRHSARILLEILAAVVAGIVLVGALGAWRLSQPEPLRLSFLTPYVEQALTLPERSLNVAIDETLITWAGWGRTI